MNDMTDKMFFLLVLIIFAALDIAYFVFRVANSPSLENCFFFAFLMLITGWILYGFVRMRGPLFRKKRQHKMFYR